MSIAEVKTSADQKMLKAIESLKTSLSRIRTGRAHIGILDHIHVDYYGSSVPIGQVANITLIDARTLGVAVWEKKLATTVEKAIRDSGLGLNPANDGQLVRVDAIASVEETTGPRGIAHYDRVRSFTLSASLTPELALGEAIDSLTAIVEAELPPLTTIALGGDARELSESGNELLLAFGLAILVVFMVLASQFESMVHPFTVLMAVPLAVVGAIFTLKLAGATINLYSQIGMILLVGLVTKNSILLVDYANQLRAKGLEVFDAMLEAGRVRLRPILMTSVATIMGAVPIAIGSGAGATSRRPLGYAIVGGIAFSTLLTLFVVPVVWMGLERVLARRRAPEASPALTPVEAP